MNFDELKETLLNTYWNKKELVGIPMYNFVRYCIDLGFECQIHFNDVLIMFKEDFDHYESVIKIYSDGDIQCYGLYMYQTYKGNYEIGPFNVEHSFDLGDRKWNMDEVIKIMKEHIENSIKKYKEMRLDIKKRRIENDF